MVIGICVAGALCLLGIYLFVFRWSVNVPDYMAARHYRFGKPSGEGTISGKRIVVIPYIDHLVLIDQRIQRNSLDDINVLTKERQSMKVSSTIIWKAENAAMTIENIKPEDIQPTFFKIIESVIKNECSKMSVDEILENRTALSRNLHAILKETADKWGLNISSVNITSVTVTNEKFMRNMALPKEIEIERKAKLAEIEKELTVELKSIERDTEAKLASLKAEKTIGEEKEMVASVLEQAEKNRIQTVQTQQKQIEEIMADIARIQARVETQNEAEKKRELLKAEAEGLEERIKVLANYSQEGLNYEMIQNLPEIYKNLKMGDVTLFQTDTDGSVSTLGFAAKSLLNMVTGNKEQSKEVKCDSI